MNVKILMLFIIIITQLGTVAGAEIRTWVSSGGRFKTEAELVRILPDGERVCLRKVNGKEVIVKIELLSQEDQEYINGNKNPPDTEMNKGIGNPNSNSGNMPLERTFEIKEWKEIDPQGMAVFIAKDGTEQKRSCDTFSPKVLQFIIECEIKKNTSDKFFLPEQIRNQIDEYCRIHRIEPEKSTSYVEDPEIVARNKAKEAEYYRKLKAVQKKSRSNASLNEPKYPSYESTYVSKTTEIDKNLNQAERNSLCLLLLKYQEMAGEKYSQTNFDSLMNEISQKKFFLNSGDSLDIYALNKIFYDFIFWNNIGANARVSKEIYDMESSGLLKPDFAQLAIQTSLKVEKESEMKKELMMKEINALYPYYNALTGNKHNSEEAKRISENESKSERENYQKDTNKLFK